NHHRGWRADFFYANRSGVARKGSLPAVKPVCYGCNFGVALELTRVIQRPASFSLRARSTPIFNYECAPAASRKISVVPSLKGHAAAHVHYCRIIGLLSDFRQYPKFSAWRDRDRLGDTGSFTNATGALSFV